MEAANHIQRLREGKGWSRPELGRRMGTSGQQVERLEKSQRRLTHDWIKRAADALGVPSTAIISDEAGHGDSVREQPGIRSADAGDAVQITRLDLSLPMGPGALVDDYVEEEPVIFDQGYLRSLTRSPADRLRLARGVGDSMYPTLQTNDQVWIDTTQNELRHSDRIYAATINGGAAIKRLRPIDGGRKIKVISDNKTIEPYDVEADEVQIWGRVIRFVRDL